MLKARGNPNFPLEPLAGDTLGEVRSQKLDDDCAPELQLLRDIHARHSAAAKLSLDGVRAGKGPLKLVADFGRGQLPLHQRGKNKHSCGPVPRLGNRLEESRIRFRLPLCLQSAIRENAATSGK